MVIVHVSCPRRLPGPVPLALQVHVQLLLRRGRHLAQLAEELLGRHQGRRHRRLRRLRRQLRLRCRSVHVGHPYHAAAVLPHPAPGGGPFSRRVPLPLARVRVVVAGPERGQPSRLAGVVATLVVLLGVRLGGEVQLADGAVQVLGGHGGLLGRHTRRRRRLPLRPLGLGIPVGGTAFIPPFSRGLATLLAGPREKEVSGVLVMRLPHVVHAGLHARVEPHLAQLAVQRLALGGQFGGEGSIVGGQPGLQVVAGGGGGGGRGGGGGGGRGGRRRTRE